MGTVFNLSMSCAKMSGMYLLELVSGRTGFISELVRIILLLCLETCIVQLPTSEGGFEAQLQAACADFLPEIMGHGLPAGSPAVIMISPAAMGAVKLIKKLPGLNKVCHTPCQSIPLVCLSWRFRKFV